MKLLFVLLTGVASAIAVPSWSHEFWIDVTDYTIAPGETLEAALRVGEDFEGSSYAYVPTNFRRFEIAMGDAAPEPVEGRIGDRPALSMVPEEGGLTAILHVTRDYELTWETWEQFTSFVGHKAGDGVLERHAEQGYAEDAVREVYSRYGKALVAVGEGAGEDRPFGLLTEIVALENPYTGDLSDGLDVRVLYQGEPRAEAQVEIFAKDGDGAVEVTKAQTDAQGVATIPVSPGSTYLLDSVVFRQPAEDTAPEFDPMWETLWASLTFAAPAE